MTTIGIDPGASGGFAVLFDNGTVDAWAMPPTERDVWESIMDLEAHAVIEAVHSMPGQGVSSTFKFGANYGMLRAFLVAAGIPFQAVTPGKWQKHFGLTRKFKSKVEKKNAHKGLAQQLFPSVTVTHAVADALLIAKYACSTTA